MWAKEAQKLKEELLQTAEQKKQTIASLQALLDSEQAELDRVYARVHAIEQAWQYEDVTSVHQHSASAETRNDHASASIEATPNASPTNPFMAWSNSNSNRSDVGTASAGTHQAHADQTSNASTSDDAAVPVAQTVEHEQRPPFQSHNENRQTSSSMQPMFQTGGDWSFPPTTQTGPQQQEKQGELTSNPSARRSNPTSSNTENAGASTTNNGTQARADVEREVKDQLLNSLRRFLPERHDVRKGLEQRLPSCEQKRAAPHELCNRYCNESCVKQSVRGFLKAFKEKTDSDDASKLKKRLLKVVSRYHPDKQQQNNVEHRRAAAAEAACQCATELQNLLQEMDFLNVVAQLPHRANRCIRINRVRVTEPLRSIKERVADEEADQSIFRCTLRVDDRLLPDESKSLQDEQIEDCSVFQLV